MKIIAISSLFMLVLVTPLEAAVIHTIVNETFGFGPGVSLDLNGDGAPDVNLQITGGMSSGSIGEGFVAQQGFGGGVALASSGQFIGPSTPFSSMVETGDVSCTPVGGHVICAGVPFSKTFFVGVEFFDIDSNVHFGWARIDLEAHQPPDCCPLDILTATVVDDAYETIPDAAIRIPGTVVPEPDPSLALAVAAIVCAAWSAGRVRRARSSAGR